MNTVLSCGIIPVRYHHGRWEFLILRCFKYWDFPKGLVEPDEDPLEAAVREFQEETGLSELKFSWAHAFRETEPYSKGKIARYYLAEALTGEVKLTPNPESGIVEHHEYRWLPYEEARKLLVPRVQKIIDWAHRRVQELDTKDNPDTHDR